MENEGDESLRDMDVLVRTPQEIQKRLRMGDSFYEEILERGKVLYERRFNRKMAFKG